MLNWYSVFLDEQDFPTVPLENIEQNPLFFEHCNAFKEVLSELKARNKRKTGPKSRRVRERQDPFMYETLMNRLDSSFNFNPKLVILGCLLVALCALTNILFVVGAVNAYATLTAAPEQTFSYSSKTIVNESGVFIEEYGENLTLSILAQQQKHRLEEQKNFHEAMTSFGTTVVKKAVKHVENIVNKKKMANNKF